jgi:hypothetical protein
MAVRDVRGDEAGARMEQARAIGLFRYRLIREAADPELSTKARGRLVRQVAAGSISIPPGGWCGPPGTLWTTGFGSGGRRV